MYDTDDKLEHGYESDDLNNLLFESLINNVFNKFGEIGIRLVDDAFYSSDYYKDINKDRKLIIYNNNHKTDATHLIFNVGVTKSARFLNKNNMEMTRVYHKQLETHDIKDKISDDVSMFLYIYSVEPKLDSRKKGYYKRKKVNKVIIKNITNFNKSVEDIAIDVDRAVKFVLNKLYPLREKEQI